MKCQYDKVNKYPQEALPGKTYCSGCEDNVLKAKKEVFDDFDEIFGILSTIDNMKVLPIRFIIRDIQSIKKKHLNKATEDNQ